MLGVKLIEKKRNTWIHQQTKVTDVVEKNAQVKWQLAGDLARKQDGCCTKTTLEWRQRSQKIGKGIPSTRRLDDMTYMALQEYNG